MSVKESVTNDREIVKDVVKKSAGHALQFPMDGKDAIEVWGVPKNLVVEVRLANLNAVFHSDQFVSVSNTL